MFKKMDIFRNISQKFTKIEETLVAKVKNSDDYKS